MREKKWIIATVIITYLIGFFLGINIFLKVVFTEKYNYQGIEILSFNPINIESLDKIVEKTTTNLSKKGLKIENQTIVLCDNRWLFSFFSLNVYKSFAINKDLTNTIFVSNFKLNDDKCYSDFTENNCRTLTGVLTHEIGHSILRKKLGLFKYKTLPKWKNEGFCDYLAEESSYNFNSGIKNFITNKEIDNLSYQYFKYRLYVNFILNHKGDDLNIFLGKRYNLDSLKRDILSFYK